MVAVLLISVCEDMVAMIMHTTKLIVDIDAVFIVDKVVVDGAVGFVVRVRVVVVVVLLPSVCEDMVAMIMHARKLIVDIDAVIIVDKVVVDVVALLIVERQCRPWGGSEKPEQKERPDASSRHPAPVLQPSLLLWLLPSRLRTWLKLLLHREVVRLVVGFSLLHFCCRTC